MRGKTPLIEPVPSDAHSSWVTFVWRGDERTQRVELIGGLASGDLHKWLTRLPETDLWDRTERIPNDARFAYSFRVNTPLKFPQDAAAEKKQIQEHPLRPDPLNRNDVGFGSMLEMPDAPPQPWLGRVPGAPKRLSDWAEKVLPLRDVRQLKLANTALNQDQPIAIYTPPNYDPAGEPCGLVILFDGGGFQLKSQIPAPTILDNLIRQKTIPPVVAVFVSHIHRNEELACSDASADFLVRELIPWVRKNYRVSDDPSRTIVGGMSFGGLMASYCGYRHPKVFGNVLSLSGSYQWDPRHAEFGPMLADVETGWLTQQFVASPRLPVRFYLAAGKFENFYPFSLLMENRRFRDVLESKGYAVTYSEFPGGHDPVSWRGSFVEGLIVLTPDPVCQDVQK
jgi:enterochelin esterase family protein